MSHSGTKAEATVREIYRPILRGYFTVFAAYYLIMTPLNFWDLTGLDRYQLVSVSFVAAVLGLFGCWYMRKPAAPNRVETLLIAMNCMVVLNVTIALSIEFQTEKLTYFIIMAMLFALASVNVRQSFFSIAFASLALIAFFPRLDATTFSAFAFLAFAAAMASLAIAFFLRKAITRIADAKIEAEAQLEEAQAVSEDMRQKSLSDSLTNLPNRRAFFSTLRKITREQGKDAQSSPKSSNVWLMLIDLDGFKSVNDVHGHLTGDILLKQVAGRLEMFAGQDIHVSRMGGDEFNMILVGEADEDGIKARCNELLELLSERYIIEGRHVTISCSIGCKLLDPSEVTRSQINQADYALMVAKKKGKNCAVLFNEGHAKQAKERFKVESALRQADFSRELNLVFQPQFALGSGKCINAEALLRWSSPTLGDVAPDQFIQIAEESGLISDITLIVVEKAFREIQTWSHPISVSINLSSLDLISDPLIDQIIETSRRLGINASLIEFEVTETAMLADIEKATANLNRLSEEGFSIALDDFGTGYSNFNYLRKLPISKLKVDRSFMENPGDPMSEKILHSLAVMARTLGVHCLLEGVENEFDLLIAKRVGAESVQGFFFGKPITASELMVLLTDEQIEPAETARPA